MKGDDVRCIIDLKLPYLMLVQPCEPGVLVTVLQKRKSRLSKGHLVIQLLLIACLLNARTEDGVASNRDNISVFVELTVTELYN